MLKKGKIGMDELEKLSMKDIAKLADACKICTKANSIVRYVYQM